MHRLGVVLTMVALPAAVTSPGLGFPRGQTLLDASGVVAGRMAGTLVRRSSLTVFFSRREILHAASEEAVSGLARRADRLQSAGRRHQALLLRDTEALPPNPTDARDTPAAHAQVGATILSFAGTTPQRPSARAPPASPTA